jgi:hypothetical protein
MNDFFPQSVKDEKSQSEQSQICNKNMQNLEHIYAYLCQFFFFWGGGGGALFATGRGRSFNYIQYRAK